MINAHRTARFAMMLAAGAALVAGAAFAKMPEERKWIEVRTDNFLVRSTMSAKKTREVAHRLELFRAAFNLMLGVQNLSDRVPTNIYLVRRWSEFHGWKLDSSIAGLFRPGVRENTILVRDTRGMSESAIMLHEYVHYMLNNHSRLNYPRWFQEGLAEYMSAARLRGDNFDLGLVAEGRIDGLRQGNRLPMRKILQDDGYDKWSDADKSSFYSGAWALVHYLRNNPPQGKSVMQAMGQYVAMTDSGKSDLEAFEQAFGMSHSRLEARMFNRYFNKRTKYSLLRYDAGQLLPAFQADTRTLTSAQIALGLGVLAHQRGAHDEAMRLYKIAATDPAGRARAEAGMGDMLLHKGLWDDAMVHLQRTLELAPGDPLSHLDMAHYWHLWAEATDDDRLRKARLKNARRHYVQAWKLDDAMPEIYAEYGRSFLLDGNWPKAVEMLEVAESLLPSDLGIRLNLARAWAGVGRHHDAIRAAQRILSHSHIRQSSQMAQNARTLMLASLLKTGQKPPDNTAKQGG